MESELSAVDWGVIIIAAVLFFERIGKAIPNDATNPVLATIRKLSKLASLYVSNRETKDDPIN